MKNGLILNQITIILNLHLIGGLQTNKVKLAVKLFDYIHSVDNEKLAKKISDEQQKQNKKVKVFIQVNIGNEEQKFGVNKSLVSELYSYCKTLNLEVVGLMCIPPLNEPSEIFFKEMSELNKKLNFEGVEYGDVFRLFKCNKKFCYICKNWIPTYLVREIK